MPGGSDKPLPLVFIDDAVDALIRITLDDRTVGKTYNIIHSHMPTRAEYLKFYRELSGDKRPVVKVPLSPLMPLLKVADWLGKKVYGRELQLEHMITRQAKAVYYSADRLKDDIGYYPTEDYRAGLSKIFRASAND